MPLPEKLNILVITLSDRASRGEYQDLSGPEIKNMLTDHFSQTSWKYQVDTILIPDDPKILAQTISSQHASRNIIFTTGGTGIGPRDFTIEVINPMLDKEIPGIMELIRVKYGMENPNALLSRSVAGLINDCMIFTLPGSVKAVREYMSEIIKVLEHLVYMQYGMDIHKKSR
ncbi:MAG: MogA/MoaB family molybdenum cofactor biosynthesis protein [Bacteroidota bacterium]